MKRFAVVLAALSVAASLRLAAEEPPDLNRLWSQGKAEGAGPVRLATFPLRVEDIGYLRPMGLMASGHVTPSDHLYLIPRETPDKGERFDILAVADGHIVVVQWRPQGNPDPTVFHRDIDFKVILEHSATVWSYVDHLVALDEAITSAAGEALKPGGPVFVRIPVKAGQVIGKVGHQTFDFALMDAKAPKKNFVRPEQFYGRDPWKLFTVDPFDAVDDPLKSKLLAFSPRTAAPRGGRFDYDMAGKLVGSWYREKTGGYAGLDRRMDYWVGHLAFAYHYMDPLQVIVSMGDFEGKARQFQVKGNGPDPAAVSKETGLVKFELIMPLIDDKTGKPFPNTPERPCGTLLVQVLEGDRIRVEAVPGKTGAEVKEFSEAARVYER